MVANATTGLTEMTLEELIIGKSEAMVALRQMIELVARSNISVLLSGPSGSGKELVAKAIHQASQRGDKPFVALNCGAIPNELIESELFGHEKGSFTGAHARRIGHFEAAHNSTLFLDEIGDMRFDMQVKLLRVLEEHMVSRIGSSEVKPVDVRVISATHQNLDEAIAQGRFREDLFFRLGVVVIHVPDLASRVEDIPELITMFHKRHPVAQRCSYDESALDVLMDHEWPGNVRELRNFVDRAAVLFGGEQLSAANIEFLLRPTAPLSFGMLTRLKATQATAVPDVVPTTSGTVVPLRRDCPIDLKREVESIELDRIHAALDLADGIIAEAARLLSLKRTTLIEKMRKYGVSVAA